MIDKKLQALNEKIARWCGKEEGYITLMGIRYKPYTESLDALFKDAVPKLLEKGFEVVIKVGEHHCSCTISAAATSLKDWEEYFDMANTPELALCKAISEYIDAEEKKCPKL
jgi:hypothetical protein